MLGGIAPGYRFRRRSVVAKDLHKRHLRADLADRKRASQPTGSESGLPIEVVCDECDQKSLFPANQRGTIQDCPACGAFVDVGEVDEQDPYWLEADEANEA
jgi:hypothetical protein